MKVKAKAGFDLDVKISGYRNEPSIMVESFTFAGKSHPGGCAHIQHWVGKERGLYIGKTQKASDVYIQIGANMASLDQTIAALPEKVVEIVLERYTIDADGYEIAASRYNIPRILVASNGYVIQKASMENFLKKKAIERIEISEAIALYESEHDMEAKKKASEDASRRAKAIYDDDVAELGEEEAKFQWLSGIPDERSEIERDIQIEPVEEG